MFSRLSKVFNIYVIMLMISTCNGLNWLEPKVKQLGVIFLLYPVVVEGKEEGIMFQLRNQRSVNSFSSK